MRGAWRSTELSSALMARWRSIFGGATLARVGRKPSRARPRVPISRTRIATTIPRIKLRIEEPRHHTGPFYLQWSSARSVGVQAARFADQVGNFGQEESLLRRRKRNGRVERREADNRAVEIVEGFFVNDRGDFSGQSSGARVLMEDDHFVGLLHGGGDRFA